MKSNHSQWKRFQWIFETLREHPSFIQKSWFGCRACYLYGRLMLVLAPKEEPWNGVLLPTGQEHHGRLCREFTALGLHPVLKKWLYVSADSEEFEETVNALLERILANDARIGV